MVRKCIDEVIVAGARKEAEIRKISFWKRCRIIVRVGLELMVEIF